MNPLVKSLVKSLKSGQVDGTWFSVPERYTTRRTRCSPEHRDPLQIVLLTYATGTLNGWIYAPGSGTLIPELDEFWALSRDIRAARVWG